MQDVGGLIAVCMVLGLILVAGQQFERTKRRVIRFHIIYAAVVLASFLLLPMVAKEALFSPLSVVVVGTGKHDFHERLKSLFTFRTFT